MFILLSCSLTFSLNNVTNGPYFYLILIYFFLCTEATEALFARRKRCKRLHHHRPAAFEVFGWPAVLVNHKMGCV